MYLCISCSSFNSPQHTTLHCNTLQRTASTTRSVATRGAICLCFPYSFLLCLPSRSISPRTPRSGWYVFLQNKYVSIYIYFPLYCAFLRASSHHELQIRPDTHPRKINIFVCTFFVFILFFFVLCFCSLLCLSSRIFSPRTPDLGWYAFQENRCVAKYMFLLFTVPSFAHLATNSRFGLVRFLEKKYSTLCIHFFDVHFFDVLFFYAHFFNVHFSGTFM